MRHVEHDEQLAEATESLEHPADGQGHEHGADHASGGHHGEVVTGGWGHADHAAMFRDRFRLSLLLTVPVVVYSHPAGLVGYTPPEFAGSMLSSPVVGTVVSLYGGWPFLIWALQQARARRPGMMLLIGMAIGCGMIVA